MYYLYNKATKLYYSLLVSSCLTPDKSKASQFESLKEATDWAENHSLFFENLIKLGFSPVQ